MDRHLYIFSFNSSLPQSFHCFCAPRPGNIALFPGDPSPMGTSVPRPPELEPSPYRWERFFTLVFSLLLGPIPNICSTHRPFLVLPPSRRGPVPRNLNCLDRVPFLFSHREFSSEDKQEWEHEVLQRERESAIQPAVLEHRNCMVSVNHILVIWLEQAFWRLL